MALDAFVISLLVIPDEEHPLYKIVFNLCALPLTIWVSCIMCTRSSQRACNRYPKSTQDVPDSGTLLLPLAALRDRCIFGLNSWLITFAISLGSRDSAPFNIWRETLYAGCRSTILEAHQ